MNIVKHVTSRMMSKQKTMLGVISNAIKNNMRTSTLVLGLMGLPIFSSMAEIGDNSSPVTVSTTMQNSSQELLTTLNKEIVEIKKTLSEKKIPIDEDNKSGLYSDKMIANCLTKPMEKALVHSQSAQGSIQSLELVNKILPSFKDLATLISDKVEPLKLTKDNLEDEKVKELLNTMRMSITDLLKDYTKKDSDFDVLQKWFLQKLRSGFYAIDNNSGSNLLKDSDFRTGLTNIRNKLAEDFKIDDIKVKQSPEESNNISHQLENNLVSGTKLEDQYIHLSIQKNETLFNDIEHKVIGIDLGTKNVVFTSNTFATIDIIEDIYSSKICPAIKIAATLEKTFSEGTKAGNTGVNRLQSTADIPGLIKEYYEECQSNSDHTNLKSVEGYNYLTQLEYKKGRNCIVPIQDMATEIDINNPSEYGKKQIFGIMLQAKRHFTKQYDNKDRLKSDGKTVDLNLTFNDQVPEKNKEIIAAIYAEVYAEEFCEGNLSNINVSYINQSDAALTTYLYENYTNKLQAITNHDKLVVLDLGQSGLRMKGLNGTNEEIQLTKSKAFNDISGDLIDEAIWNVCKDKIIEKSGIDANTLETDISLKSKCLNEINKAKEKLSAAGADTIVVSIDLGGDDDVEFVFSIGDINTALDKANLIETFTDDIQNGVKEMFGSSQKIEDIEFTIVGGSLRIPCLKKAIQDLNGAKKLNQTLNMDESPAYGAGYTSLLNEKYKNALSKKVDSKKILSIKDNKLHSDNENLEDIKSELDRLANSSGNYQKCAKLRNAIEADCYTINNKIAEFETDNKEYIKLLSDKIVKQLHVIGNKPLGNDLKYLNTLKSMLNVDMKDYDNIVSCLENLNSFIVLTSTENSYIQAKYASNPGAFINPSFQKKMSTLLKKIHKIEP